MTRPLRIEFPGAVYHITSRGDRREPIFVDDVDRLALLDVLGAALDRFDASALAWCLMGNHYHFVVQTRQGNLSRLMRHVNGTYTQRFNQRHRKVGHLFQGRYKAILVDKDSYLLEVCRYVELNPVRANMVAAPGEWRWSSYRVLSGLEAEAPHWLDRTAVWSYVSGESVERLKGEGNAGEDSALARLRAASAYAALVAAGHGVKLWADHLNRQVFLGDDTFVERMQSLASDSAMASVDIPREQRVRPKTVKDWAAELGCRDTAIVAAFRQSRQTMTEIAMAMDVSVSTVSRAIRRWESVSDKDRLRNKRQMSD